MPTAAGGGTGDVAADVPRDDLTQYVKAFLDRTGWSVRELARRARDPISGIGVSHGWVNDIVTQTMERAPDMRRLRALAAAMGEHVDGLARLAAAQWLGVSVIEVPAGEGEWVAVPVRPGMKPDQREQLRIRLTAEADRLQR